MLFQLAAGDVKQRAPAALLVEPAVLSKSLKVLRGGRACDICLVSIFGVCQRQAKQSLVERDDEAFGISLLPRHRGPDDRMPSQIA